MGIDTSCVSRFQPLGKSGRSGRSIMRAVRVAFSPALPSRRKKLPGILPAAYMRSSTSTVSGRKSTSRWPPAVAVESTLVSPAETTTEPLACLASLPVSNAISVPPISTETRLTASLIASFQRRLRLAAVVQLLRKEVGLRLAEGEAAQQARRLPPGVGQPERGVAHLAHAAGADPEHEPGPAPPLEIPAVRADPDGPDPPADAGAHQRGPHAYPHAAYAEARARGEHENGPVGCERAAPRPAAAGVQVDHGLARIADSHRAAVAQAELVQVAAAPQPDPVAAQMVGAVTPQAGAIEALLEDAPGRPVAAPPALEGAPEGRDAGL